MKKNKTFKKQWCATSLLAIACSSALLLNPITSFAGGWGTGGKVKEGKVVNHWSINGVTRDQGVGEPVAISFNPDQKSDQLTVYGSNKVFYEEYYKNKFHWYSIVPPYNANNDEKDMVHMLENRQTVLGDNGRYLVDARTSNNLKWGSVDYLTGTYNGKFSGTTIMSTGTYKGKGLEWRYLGYSPDGEPIANPYFPDDTNGNHVWYKKDWQTVDYIEAQGYQNKTKYDSRTNKIEWFKTKLFNMNPALRHPNKSVQQDAEYYADRLSVRTDPDNSTGIAIGWHNYPDKVWSSAKKKFVYVEHLYYSAFVMNPPEKPNLRLIEYRVYDKATGTLLGHVTRDSVNSANENPITSIIYKNSSGKQYELVKGKQYVFEATVKNMDQAGLKAHNTVFTPVTLDYMYSYDQSAFETNEYDAYFQGNLGAKPSPATTTIPYGKTVTFKWESAISSAPDQYAKTTAQIPIGFYGKGDNTNTSDDTSSLTFKVAQEDMSIKDQIDVLDLQGNVVDYVVPNQPYSLRFYVNRPLGSPVGDSKNPDDNPFATVDVKVTDNGSVKKNLVGVATQTLNQGKTVEVVVPNAIVPKTAQLSIDAKIDDIHEVYGQNMANGNDGWIHRDVKSNVNIAVSNAFANPSLITLPSGVTSDKQDVAFNFTITNTNVEKQTKSIPYVIKKGTTVLASGEFSVPPNVPTPETVYINNVPVYTGNIDFTIEVNPQPRKWYEYTNGSDPYKDNVATTSIAVQESKFPVCTVPNTENKWNTTYYIYDWTGHTNKIYIKGYGWFYWDVIDTWKSSEKTVSHYERYYIDKVLFRSKLTDDTKGTQQGNDSTWINLLNSNYSQSGKVKAGYGFDLKVIAKYETNAYTASPKPWTSGANGRAVYPSWSYTDVPNLVGMTMPFKDKSGNTVKYTLAGTRSGSWDNETQSYVMPLQNSKFAKDNNLYTNEIYVNETAQDGTYYIRIDTLPFYGNDGKPYTTKKLCDSKNVAIKILGSNTDDLKTHVTQ